MGEGRCVYNCRRNTREIPLLKLKVKEGREIRSVCSRDGGVNQRRLDTSVCLCVCVRVEGRKEG